MRTRLLSLLALFAALAGLAILTGCGSDSKDSASGSGGTVEFDLQKAAKATADKGSAEMALSVSANDGKKTQSLAVTGKIDFKTPKIDAQLDLGDVLKANNVKATGDTTTRLLVDGKKLWVKLPQVEGLALPGGKQWIALDLNVLIDALDLKTQQKKATAEPLAPVKMDKVGTETLDGTEVSHLKADATLRDLINGIPDEKQRSEAIAQLEKQKDGKKALDQKVPIEVWVDGDNALHRVKATISVDDSGTKNEASMDLTFKNFGTDVTIDPPASGESFDATQFLTQFADQFKQGLSGATGTP